MGRKGNMATYRGNGKRVSSRTMKKVIMTANGWTEEQYRKQYDLFKNKLRAYESFREAHGAEVEPQSPQQLLYRQAKAKLREGSEYSPSIEMQRIQAFSAVSITKGRKLAQDLESSYSMRRAATFEQATSKQFAGMIASVPKAQEIVDTIEDPVMQEEALKALAAHIHAKQTPSGEVFAGEYYGSGDAGEDFDFDEYLE